MYPIDYGNHPAVFAHRDVVWNSTGFANPYDSMYKVFMFCGGLLLAWVNVLTPNTDWNPIGLELGWKQTMSRHQCRDDLDELMAKDR
eukprot:UN19134